MKEIWKDIEGYEGIYQVSNLGRVKGLGRKVERADGIERTIKEKIMLDRSKGKYGHRIIGLSKDGKQKTFYVHILVANAFVPNPNNKPFVLHRLSKVNGGTDAADNLYWGDAKENAEDRERDKRNEKESLENRVKELELQVQELKKRLAEAGL